MKNYHDSLSAVNVIFYLDEYNRVANTAIIGITGQKLGHLDGLASSEQITNIVENHGLNPRWSEIVIDYHGDMYDWAGYIGLKYETHREWMQDVADGVLQ